MSDIKLTATLRTDFGKGAARRTRREGLIPAVLYGHGTDPLHVSLPGHETFLALKHSNALFSIDVEGDEKLAIVRDVQRDPVRQVIEHVDLLLVNKGEKVSVEVNIVVIVDHSAALGLFVVVLTTFAAGQRQSLNVAQGFFQNLFGIGVDAPHARR